MSTDRAQEWLQSYKKNHIFKKEAIKVSITAGKGGVGKTTAALKLSLEMVKKGHKVLLLDCDYNLSNSIIKLGLTPDNRFYDFLEGSKKIRRLLNKL